ncbi:sigma-54 dependent transcriptional regulator [Sphingosinicella sp. BN140058]|uniref:sigma-54-dependent transcriptional regulator n=1 Tax=Sphingosinicella sp. BN140058 TaxID=1892855 RepID=UPI001012C861|nr:response regulator [Sphingosinicella sp. BN140058]QAY78719.1 sigma-54-dependent Fis family transcriptional regulator [Sphingosinicella sp. BN140058]
METRFFQDAGRADRPAADTSSGNGRSDEASSRATILLIDDDPIVSRALEIAFVLAGHGLERAASPEEAHSRLARRRFDAILLDLNFAPGESGGAEGLACLARILAEDPAACVVVITAHSGIRVAVAAMQAGARDFVMKPWRNAELIAKMEAAIARGGPASPAAAAAARPLPGPARLLGDSPAIETLRAMIRRVAPTSAGITITGRPGSGRTLAATAIHAASAHAATPLVRVDLRDPDAWALLDAAHGSVLLRYPDSLDAVNQARLLARLPPDLRCIGIVDDAVRLSPGLRRRIATVEIPVPALAARGNDILLLARHFAAAAAERFGRPPTSLSPAAEAAIRAAAWPDEVRGLALAIERAVLLADDGRIDAAALALPAAGQTVAQPVAPYDLDETEKKVIEAALREHRFNVTRAADALGLSRGALYRRMARHGL